MNQPGDLPAEAPARRRRYECRWRDAEPGNSGKVHYWVDHAPSEPHWPESPLMRWDLRPKDWHRIWPELIDHPCALLFAPIHPDRSGPPRFRDWVESWPKQYAWREDLPAHLHPAVEKALLAISTGLAPSRPAGNGGAKSAEPPMPATPPAITSATLLEHLVVALLDLPDETREDVAQALSTLAMAPDSSRTLERLKRLLPC